MSATSLLESTAIQFKTVDCVGRDYGMGGIKIWRIFIS